MNVSKVCCRGSDLKYCIENVSSSYKKLPLTDYRTWYTGWRCCRDVRVASLFTQSVSRNGNPGNSCCSSAHIGNWVISVQNNYALKQRKL